MNKVQKYPIRIATGVFTLGFLFASVFDQEPIYKVDAFSHYGNAYPTRAIFVPTVLVAALFMTLFIYNFFCAEEWHRYVRRAYLFIIPITLTLTAWIPWKENQVVHNLSSNTFIIMLMLLALLAAYHKYSQSVGYAFFSLGVGMFGAVLGIVHKFGMVSINQFQLYFLPLLFCWLVYTEHRVMRTSRKQDTLGNMDSAATHFD